MSHPAFRELLHRCHDYRRLVARWRCIARSAGLKLEAFARAGEYPVYCLRTRERSPRPGGLYLSAGIHGDEPAAPEALALWAEAHLPTLARAERAMPLFILPCLNPWGLVNNRRTDARDRDLNRLFDRTNLSPLRELKRLLDGRWFSFALSLHEDFDARGIYGYELHGRSPDWGAGLLKACSGIIPVDPRGTIDGRRFKHGLLLRRGHLERIPLHPETIYLHLAGHTAHSFTFETPSEYSLAQRVNAHVRLIEECVIRLCAAEDAPSVSASPARRKSVRRAGNTGSHS